MKPVFKPIHPCYEVAPGVIRLGEAVGISVEMEDEDGAIRCLLSLMDGTRTLDQLYEDVHNEYPNVSREEVESAIRELNELGLVFDAQQDADVSLSQHQRERFKVNLNYFSLFADLQTSPATIQERLLGARVTIIGVGAFGCSLLLHLSALGVKHIRIIDDDTIELSNLNRQLIFNEHDIGRLKVDVAKEFMARFHSDTVIEAIPKRLLSERDVEEHIGDSGYVMLAADYPKFLMQAWVNRVCARRNIPVVYGGVNLNKGFVYSVLPGQTGCIDCLMLHRAKRAPDYATILANYLQLHFRNPSSVTAPSLMMITGMMSSELQRIITGTGNVLSAGKVLAVDFVDFQIAAIEEWEKDGNDCPTCGHGTGEHPIFSVLQKVESELVHA